MYFIWFFVSVSDLFLSFFFFSSRRRHTRCSRDWSSDVCSSDLVVEARREDWAFDPFRLQEVDGYFRGRGSIDDKAMASIFVANLVRYVAEGFRPDRDIILALTTDEELSD